MTDRIYCLAQSPPISGVTYWCHLEAGHEGFHRDDLGIVLWDDTEAPEGFRPWGFAATDRPRP